MAESGNSCSDFESLLSDFAHIWEDFKNAMSQIQFLKSNCDAETRRREALEIACDGFKQDNERLRKLQIGSLNKLADQIEFQSKYQHVAAELKKMKEEKCQIECEQKRSLEFLKQAHAAKVTELEAKIKDLLREKATVEANLTFVHQDLEAQKIYVEEVAISEKEHERGMEVIKQSYLTKVGELEDTVRGLLLEKAASESTISHLRENVAAHKTHVKALERRLDEVQCHTKLKHHTEIQDLKDVLLVEQREKEELGMKLRDLEKELLISRAKVVQQQDSATIQQVETLKLKIMKLRKENEILKRKLPCVDQG